MRIVKILGLSAIAAIAAIAILEHSASAYRGNPAMTGPNYTADRHAAMEKAFETNDYNAWKQLMQGRGRASTVVNENNFAQFAQAHRLAEEGKITEANTIRQQLGLSTGHNPRSGAGTAHCGW